MFLALPPFATGLTPAQSCRPRWRTTRILKKTETGSLQNAPIGESPGVCPMAADSRRIKELFVAALDQPGGAARAAFLDRECAGDTELRHRLDALLKAHDAPASVLNQPLAEIAAESSNATP